MPRLYRKGEFAIKPQLEMLMECYEIMKARYSNPNVAMTALIQWAAVQMHIPATYDYATPVVTMEMNERLHSTFDIDLLREDRWDWFGEAALKAGLGQWVPSTVSKEQAIEHVRRQIKTPLRATDVVFDPSAGTGRSFLALMELGEDCIMAGAEPLYKAYRILIINRYLYDMPGFFIRGTARVPFNSQAWQYANLFAPIHTFQRAEEKKAAS